MFTAPKAPTFAEAFAPATQQKSKKKKRNQRHCDGDELFLPPAVRAARRREANHWSAAGSRSQALAPAWSPPTTESEITAPAFALPELVNSARQRSDALVVAKEARNAELGEWASHTAAVEVLLQDGVLQGGEDLDVGSSDEPQAMEMLSPEESSNKSAIWHEANHDLLELWALTAKRKEEQKQQKFAKAADREEQLLLAAEAREARMAREMRQQRGLRPQEAPGDSEVGLLEGGHERHSASSGEQRTCPFQRSGMRRRKPPTTSEAVLLDGELGHASLGSTRQTPRLSQLAHSQLEAAPVIPSAQSTEDMSLQSAFSNLPFEVGSDQASQDRFMATTLAVDSLNELLGD